MGSNKMFGIENIFFLWILLISVSATSVTQLADPRLNPIGYGITGVLAFMLHYRYRVKFTKNIILCFALLLVWTIIHFFTDIEFKLLHYLNLLLYVYLGFLVVNVFRENLFRTFVHFVYVLTIVDVLLWTLQHILGTDVFLKAAPLSSTGTSLGSFLFFSISNETIYEDKTVFGLLRNAGFCWEPGYYASVLVFAIFMNLSLTNYQIKNNRQLYVLFVGLLSTFSTTGYSALMVLSITHYFFVSRKSFSFLNIVSFGVIIVVVVYAMELPFMRDKIMAASNSDSFVTENERRFRVLDTQDEFFTVDRFEGMSLDLQSIIDKPWFGFGTVNNSYVQQKICSVIVISNGLTHVIARFGIPIAFFIFLFLVKNSVFLREQYPCCANSWFLIWITISVSYNFITCPLFISFSFMKYMLDKKKE